MQHSHTNTRCASHAGSWYSSDGTLQDYPGSRLANEIKGWIDSAQCTIDNVHQVKAIIGPYSFIISKTRRIRLLW